jgi:hypothetical protein
MEKNGLCLRRAGRCTRVCTLIFLAGLWASLGPRCTFGVQAQAADPPPGAAVVHVADFDLDATSVQPERGILPHPLETTCHSFVANS